MPININIGNFDDRDRQEKLQKYVDKHRGSNVSIKELIMNDLLCNANKKLFNQILPITHLRPQGKCTLFSECHLYRLHFEENLHLFC